MPTLKEGGGGAIGSQESGMTIGWELSGPWLHRKRAGQAQSRYRAATNRTAPTANDNPL